MLTRVIDVGPPGVRVALLIVLKPVKVIPTTLPEAADVTFKTVDGAPMIISVALPISAGIDPEAAAVSEIVEVPADTDGTVNVRPAVEAKEPSVPTVIEPRLSVMPVELSLAVTDLVPGEKPAPEIPTVAPAIACDAVKVMVGCAKIVSCVVDADRLAASTTVMFSVCATAEAGIITAAVAGVWPSVFAAIVVVFACVAVLYHVVAVPFRYIESAELAVKLYPLIPTTEFGLTAVEVVTVTAGFTVIVVEACAVPTDTVIVCEPPAMFAPVSADVSVTYSSMPPLVFVCEQPTDAALNGVPSNVTEIACFIGKFEPVMLIDSADEPATTPEDGDTLTDATVVVMLAEAVLYDESVAEMTCVPGRNVGTVNVAIICPALNVAVAETVMPSIVNVWRVVVPEFAKPVPTIVTFVPTAAVVGLTIVIDGAPVVVKVVEPPMLAVLITCEPAADVGTVNEPLVVG